MLACLWSIFFTEAWGNPTPYPCIKEEQTECVPLTQYGVENPLSIVDVLPTSEQLQPLLEDHPANSRRAKKVQTEKLLNSDTWDWLLEMGTENEVILIGESHHKIVTPTLQLQMLNVLIENAEYRQIVLEQPYSFTPLYNAYVRMEDADEATELFREHLYQKVPFQTRLALLNIVRQHNLQHPEDTISLLATDVEHDAVSKYESSALFIADLKMAYNNLPEESFPQAEREAFYAQVKDNFDATVVYYGKI